MLYEAIVVALIVWLTVGGQELLGFTMLGRPIVIAPLVGLFLGDLQTGLLVGAALETIFMGVVNIGGAASAEPGLASALAAAFAIKLGGGTEYAITLALPLGIIGLQIKQLLWIAVVAPISTRFDKYAAQGNGKAYTRLHFGIWALNWGVYSLIPFFAILVGSKATESVLKMIPDVIMHGLEIAGNLLPAVGMAMLLKMLWDNKIAVYFFLGFVLIAYLDIPLIAISAIAIIAAVIVAQNDITLKGIKDQLKQGVNISSSKNNDPKQQEVDDFYA
ncbi:MULTISPECIES: PTS sugar transporter subunit IIC [unclassified Enterococcus]|uniref:PTS mannose/fructose/sorbose/N-acetylgalactosamine transporter subunit IIC n=1 Tax=unclassified Enterococcus TaxID=2608891 RepID=UPI00155504BC|nr:MULTISPECIES: PTS sugar transporter subunit IIC [unclassified Enterococcus]MBS7577005.1 PTS sugar transporter subunit IIC [Enterococcus sp. MMGLQ5-2]MBS7584548.1 PTS sugar transporter subunit IIC [Enterococcus sp. MMGLQ5-1]NPD12403.1 PTS sugar transporter subunit IIC [Enterococcus sp. MMGLQ5-1]NPD36839.1 PTS sugar transporter subunit IIC [Enterococcus sp. MMGLQ5-2]